MFDFEVESKAKREVINLDREQHVKQQELKHWTVGPVCADLESGSNPVYLEQVKTQPTSLLYPSLFIHTSCPRISGNTENPSGNWRKAAHFPPDCYDQTPLVPQRLVLTNK